VYGGDNAHGYAVGGKPMATQRDLKASGGRSKARVDRRPRAPTGDPLRHIHEGERVRRARCGGLDAGSKSGEGGASSGEPGSGLANAVTVILKTATIEPRDGGMEEYTLGPRYHAGRRRRNLRVTERKRVTEAKVDESGKPMLDLTASPIL
jgi:hypothetical protein